MLFESLSVGDTFVAGPQPAPAGQMVSPPLRGVLLAEELRRSAVFPGQSGEYVRTLGQSWQPHREIGSGEAVCLHATVVRLVPGEGFGTVVLCEELCDSEGVRVQSGSWTGRVPSHDVLAHRTNRDVGTRAWGDSLRVRLAEDSAFGAAVATWDGTIGVRGGDHEIQFRIYRGQVVEVTPRTVHGATFTFGAPDRVWAELLTEPAARFGVSLMSGEFAVTGDAYEYLRLTKAVELLVEHARDLAQPATEVGSSR